MRCFLENQPIFLANRLVTIRTKRNLSRYSVICLHSGFREYSDHFITSTKLWGQRSMSNIESLNPLCYRRGISQPTIKTKHNRRNVKQNRRWLVVVAKHASCCTRHPKMPSFTVQHVLTPVRITVTLAP